MSHLTEEGNGTTGVARTVKEERSMWGTFKQMWGTFKQLLDKLPQAPKAASIGALVGVLSVVVTFVLRVLEALISGQISIISVETVPNIPSFLLSEYGAVGMDLVVVAFSLLVGAWAALGSTAGTQSAGKVVLPALLMFVLAIVVFLVKGFADQAVTNYESKIAGGSANVVSKFEKVERLCADANKSKTDAANTEVRSQCEKRDTAKFWQIFVPVALGLITIVVAGYGASSK